MKKSFLYIGTGVIVLVGAGIYFFSPHSQSTTPLAFETAATSTSGVQYAQITADTPAAARMKRYYNQAHHFTLEYPDNLQATELPGAGSSLMVGFKDPSTGEGFQVFSVPYDEPQITQQRFALDEPSGVMQNPQNITIDGAAATEFYSNDQAMGDTREVWFLNGGILYEVTTYKSLDSWLMQILESWKFVQ